MDNDNDFELVRRQAADALGTLPTAVALRGLLEQRGSFDRRVWQLARESGWFGVGVGESYGGLGMGLVERGALAEELGRHLASAPVTVTSCFIIALARFGSVIQRARWLRPALEGEAIGTLACFEAADGGIPTEPELLWRKGQLYGSKVAVCAGSFADAALLPSRDEFGQFFVALADLRDSGVERVPLETLDNSRGYATLHFDGLRAEPLAGDAVLEETLAQLALLTAFEQIGGAQRCLEQARDFALERRAFGQPIGAFQAIKHGLADLYVLIEMARGAAFAAVRAAETADFLPAVAAARLAATRAYDMAAQESIQIHGGQGCAFEAEHHLHYRRARCLALEWGGPPVWRERLLRAALHEVGT